MTIETVGAIFFGWLLGLLSPAIVNGIERHYRQREIREGIVTELDDLRFRMASVAWFLEGRFGTYDRALVNWIIPILENYRGPTETTRLLDVVKNQAALDDKQFAAIVAHLKAEPGGGLNVKKYRAPYLDANIGQLGIFGEKSRAAILDVRAHLDMFNDEVDEARVNHKLTFKLTDPNNHAAVVQNVEDCYRNLAQKAKHIADRIGPILQQE